MPATEHDIIRRYIEDAIAAERNLASQLRDFASDGDDEDVTTLLSAAATQSDTAADALTSMLGNEPGALKDLAAKALSSLPRAGQLGHIQEERILQNLIAGYTITSSACGMYCALQAAALRAGNGQLEQFAGESIEKNRTLAGSIFHLIPTRAKIAYNMLTVEEIDPSVDTKYGESSWTG